MSKNIRADDKPPRIEPTAAAEAKDATVEAEHEAEGHFDKCREMMLIDERPEKYRLRRRTQAVYGLGSADPL